MKRTYNKSFIDSIFTVIDIETLGLNVREGSPILSVGLITFSVKEELAFNLINYHYFLFDPEDFKQYGAVIDQSTVDWQNNLPTIIQEHYKTGEKLSVVKGLNIISDQITQANQLAVAKGCNHYIVGNSPSFDQAMLEVFYDKADLKKPWQYWQNIDLRTLSYIHSRTSSDRNDQIKRANTAHNSIFLNVLGQEVDNMQHLASYDVCLEAISLYDIIRRLNT